MGIFAEDIVSAVAMEECAKISELAVGKTVLELGSHFGRSTVALASTARIVHAVDWHIGDGHTGQCDSAAIFVENITKYNVRGKVAFHMSKFENVLPLFRPGLFDFTFIDAFHTKEAVEGDIKLVLPLMKPHGVIAFHDYGLPQFGVTQAVDEFAKSLGVVVEVTRTVAVVRIP